MNVRQQLLALSLGDQPEQMVQRQRLLRLLSLAFLSGKQIRRIAPFLPFFADEGVLALW